MRKVKVSWKTIDSLMNKIVKDIKRSKMSFDGYTVYGPKRGGLIPAVMISHRLSIPMISNENEITSKTIIVDDINDSGKTFKRIHEKNIESIYVALFQRSTTEFHGVSYIGKEIKHPYWLIFPWEIQ